MCAREVHSSFKFFIFGFFGALGSAYHPHGQDHVHGRGTKLSIWTHTQHIAEQRTFVALPFLGLNICIFLPVRPPMNDEAFALSASLFLLFFSFAVAESDNVSNDFVFSYLMMCVC